MKAWAGHCSGLFLWPFPGPRLPARRFPTQRNRFVTAGLDTPTTTLHVDTVVGFERVAVNGVLVPVLASNPMTVKVGAQLYSLIGTARDAANASSLACLGGVSGTLTFAAPVAVADAGLGAAVVSAVAPTILRPNDRAATSQLVEGDRLTLLLVLAAVARLRDDNIPDFDGYYHCYLDNRTLSSLVLDPDFKRLYSGSAASRAMQDGQVVRMLYDSPDIPRCGICLVMIHN